MSFFLSQKKIYLVIRNDDVCALSDEKHERTVFELFEKYQIPQVVGVIPNVVADPHNCHCDIFHPLNQNPAIVSLLKEYSQKRLIEIAQHGYTHRTNTGHFALYPEITEERHFNGIDRRWLANHAAKGKFSEFNGMNPDLVKKDILKGKRCLEDLFGVSVNTFIFPWNSHDATTLKVVKECGFQRVSYDNSFLTVDGLTTLRFFHWDHHKMKEFFEEVKGIRRPVWTQFIYHSWMLSAREMEQM
ncbi:MAG: DUF2334 domain-containing protein, partial [Candidatus Moranbacteria bacterium]|nr:DUF2334 domain-containing protein [Candidatus Moranbacteria bacterium]